MVEPPIASLTSRSKVLVIKSPDYLKLDLSKGLVVGFINIAR
jgi:hypothetical protein